MTVAKRASLARIAHAVAEILIEYPDLPLRAAIWLAIREEQLIYGDADAATPLGILHAWQ
jgi:hypothetical protein